MEKKRYNKPEVTTVKVDCEIVMQTQSDGVGSPTVPADADGEDPVVIPPFINPLKWFR